MLGQRLDPNDDDAEESGWELCLVVNDRYPATLVWVVLGQKERDLVTSVPVGDQAQGKLATGV